MFNRPRNSPDKSAACAVFLLIQSPCVLNAQNFTTQIANSNPFGVNGPLPFGQALELATDLGIKGGFGYGVGLRSSYSSNFYQSASDPESEVTTSLSPNLSYTSDPEGGAPAVITASYSPSASTYLNNPDQNNFDQSGSVSFVISGSRTVISVFAGYTQLSGVDRFVSGVAPNDGGQFVTGSALSLGVNANYQLAPRTSVFASFTPSIVDYSDSAIVGFSGYSASLGGNWAATERFSFGPSLNYSTSTSDISGTVDSWGLSVNASYKATERIRMSGSIGTQLSQGSRQSGSGNFNMTGSLNASYQINELWSWSNSVQSGLSPSPTQTNYVINAWSLSSSLNRQLLIGSLGFGLSMQFSDYQDVGVVGTSQGAEQYYSGSVSYGRPLFSDRLGFSSSLTYVFNNGPSDWSQILLSAGLNLTF